jgi:hypothetical protein
MLVTKNGFVCRRKQSEPASIHTDKRPKLSTLSTHDGQPLASLENRFKFNIPQQLQLNDAITFKETFKKVPKYPTHQGDRHLNPCKYDEIPNGAQKASELFFDICRSEREFIGEELKDHPDFLRIGTITVQPHLMLQPSRPFHVRDAR